MDALITAARAPGTRSPLQIRRGVACTFSDAARATSAAHASDDAAWQCSAAAMGAGSTASSGGKLYTLTPSNGVLQVPFSRSVPALLAAAGLSLVWTYLNRRNFAPMYTLDPEYKSKEGIIATRSDAPPVFLNPLYRGLPGNIRGPDDLERP